jgi:hypothetical protein
VIIHAEIELHRLAGIQKLFDLGDFRSGNRHLGDARRAILRDDQFAVFHGAHP